MRRLLYIIFCIVFVLSSCDKGNEPDIPGSGNGNGNGTEQPGNGNGEEPGNGETPEPEIPEYDKETQVYIAGIIWDKENSFDYCTFEEAEEEAAKQDKRIPTSSEWMKLAATGYTWDAELSGYWYGEDSEKLSDSESSIFLPAMGYMLISNPTHVIDSRISGEFWCYSDKGVSGFFVSYARLHNAQDKDLPLHENSYVRRNSIISARFIQ